MIKIFFLGILGVIIVFLLTTMPREQRAPSQNFFTIPLLQTQDKSALDATLAIIPDGEEQHANQKNSARVVLETKDTMPDSVQLEIAFNPFYLRNMHIIPGDFFKDPIIPINEVDVVNGRISFVIEASDMKKEEGVSGTLATLSYTTGYVASGSAQNAKVFFLPRTNVYSALHKPLLSKTTDATISIK